MQLPLQIVAQGVELSPAERRAIAAAADKLGTFFGRIMACRVTVAQPNRRPRTAPITYRVRIDLTVPGEELVVKRQPQERVLDAIQDAFQVAGRQLQDYARRMSDTTPVEARATPLRGRVVRLFPWEGYGFLESEGREVYFHRNSVRHGGFDQLEVGTAVRFAEEEGDKGPQASTLEVSRGRHVRR